MIVSQTGEYALRAMVYLASLPRDIMATSRDVSRATSIPEPYAAKVLRKMVAAGLLGAQKGHGGGFHLVRSPEKIRFIDILEAIDERLLGDEHCAFGWERCNSKKPCPLHNAVSELKDSVNDWARRTTLATANVEDLARLAR